MRIKMYVIEREVDNRFRYCEGETTTIIVAAALTKKAAKKMLADWVNIIRSEHERLYGSNSKYQIVERNICDEEVFDWHIMDKETGGYCCDLIYLKQFKLGLF